MNASFGIDHPLIAVNDIGLVRSRLEKMGFRMTAIGKHPWGTSTSLAMFEGCLIEIMGIYDDSLLDVNPAGDFYFGRHVHKHLLEHEGVAISALHSTDIVADVAHAERAELTVSGTLEFGRDVTLPNGEQDRTKTTLALLPDTEFPRLSFFLCQQHRPELIYVPEWMNHQNTVYGIAGINIMAETHDNKSLQKKFSAIYGSVNTQMAGFSVETANGIIQVKDKKVLKAEFGELPATLKNETKAIIVAMDFYCQNIETLEGFLSTNDMEYIKPSHNPYTTEGKSILLTDPSLTGNTFFRFIEK